MNTTTDNSPSQEPQHIWDSLTFSLQYATQVAAIAAAKWRGKGDNHAADYAAVEAMRHAIHNLPVQGRVAIGEGERDKAPMLFCGETFGQKTAPLAIDIAVDPLEGTTLTAEDRPDAITIIAAAKKDCILKAPDVYMEKFVAPVHLPRHLVSFDNSVLQNITTLAQFMGKPLENMTVCCLDRERHYDDIRELHNKSVRVIVIQDGDIKASIEAALPDSSLDAYFGIGGAPEGVIAACALQCTDGFFMGKLKPRNEEEKQKIKNAHIRDPHTTYYRDDLAKPQSPLIVVATGVTRSSYLGTLNLNPVSIDKKKGLCSLDSLVFRHNPESYAYWQKSSCHIHYRDLPSFIA